MKKSEVKAKKRVDQTWKEKVKGEKAKEKTKEDKGKTKEGKEEAEPKRPLPGPDFVSFVSSLGMQALMLMGELTVPGLKETKPDYRQAKYTIDLIDMLQKKAEGNLTKEESNLVDGLLYDLRMRYVKKIK